MYCLLYLCIYLFIAFKFSLLIACSFKISLELNGEIVKSWRKVNCTTVIFDLLNVQKPQSILLCKQEKDEHSLIVNGLDLRGGRMCTLASY